jgi:hypothetical protein
MYIIKVDLRVIGWDIIHWIDLSYDREQGKALVDCGNEHLDFI